MWEWWDDVSDKANTCNKHSPAPAVVHKGSKAEKGPGGPGPKAESPSKGAKKKKAESPKLGHSTFSKLFRHKVGVKLQEEQNPEKSQLAPGRERMLSLPTSGQMCRALEIPRGAFLC